MEPINTQVKQEVKSIMIRIKWQVVSLPDIILCYSPTRQAHVGGNLMPKHCHLKVISRASISFCFYNFLNF